MSGALDLLVESFAASSRRKVYCAPEGLTEAIASSLGSQMHDGVAVYARFDWGDAGYMHQPSLAWDIYAGVPMPVEGPWNVVYLEPSGDEAALTALIGMHKHTVHVVRGAAQAFKIYDGVTPAIITKPLLWCGVSRRPGMVERAVIFFHPSHPASEIQLLAARYEGAVITPAGNGQYL